MSLTSSLLVHSLQLWSYSRLVYYDVGPASRITLDLCILINNFGMCIVYLIIIGEPATFPLTSTTRYCHCSNLSCSCGRTAASCCMMLGPSHALSLISASLSTTLACALCISSLLVSQPWTPIPGISSHVCLSGRLHCISPATHNSTESQEQC